MARRPAFIVTPIIIAIGIALFIALITLILNIFLYTFADDVADQITRMPRMVPVRLRRTRGAVVRGAGE